jgi:lauroyl/myristoyl acyltransferase
MNLQQFLASDFGTRLWMAVSQSLSPSAARRIIGWGVEIVSGRRNTRLYRAIYDNQAHVLGPEATPDQVHANVRAVLHHGALTSYDLMRVLSQGEETARQGLDFTEETWGHIRMALAKQRGVIACGCHLSAFNLGMLTFSLSGFPVQILSRAQPTGGFRLMTELRDRGMLEETPIDGPSLRKAIVCLKGGGVVGTAADWPQAADPDLHLPFFGAPAMLPTGHIRIALSANALLMPIAARWSSDRGYYTISAPPLELERTGDRHQDVIHNALRVLAVFERWIAETPEQWLMYYPVWPGEE